MKSHNFIFTFFSYFQINNKEGGGLEESEKYMKQDKELKKQEVGYVVERC